MKTSPALSRARAISLFGGLALLAASAVSATAQKPEARILAPVDNASRARLTGTRTPLAQAGSDAGRVDGTTQLQQMTIEFSRSAAQQAALDALVAAQQNPASAQYHQWLSPDEFAAEFGAADADIAKVEGWLQSQGFTVGEVSRNRSQIAFSGTVAQVENAFNTELHYFKVGTETHFGPSADLSVPAAFSSAVTGVSHLTDQRPHAQVKHLRPDQAGPRYTSSQTGNNHLTPGDVAVIYDINAAYSAGYTGTGQGIAVIGQSAIVPTDITTFQTLAGVPVRTPTLVLVPNTGVSTVFSGTGDQSESDLDLEYTSAIATGATISFVYTGNNSNGLGAFYALQYAIQNKLAPIISISYGDCETDLGQTEYNTLNGYLQQAASQGQSVIAPTGDTGSTDCYGYTNLSSANQAALAVDWPGSSQYSTAMGGTEFPAADTTDVNANGVAVTGANSSLYWIASNGTDVLTSAKSYIPEMVWNDDTASGGLSAGGGGVSQLTPGPSWQSLVSGIPTGSNRMLPDLSLVASQYGPGYLYCSSDTADTGITGSCSNGYRDSSDASLTIAGGTSFATPIFAGMLAIINQRTNTAYAGLVNPTLYTLTVNPATYASAFHDITAGSNNGCVAGTRYAISSTQSGPACPSASAGVYATATGYDEATGLGSVDLYNLMQAWANLATLTGTTTTASAATLTPPAGTSDTITFTVASASTSVTTVPTGTLAIWVDGAPAGTVTLSGGKATYSFSSSVAAQHVISAVYSGDSVFVTSRGSVTVTVPPTVSITTASAAASSPAAGANDTITFTVASANTSVTIVPTGTLAVSVDGVPAGTLTLSGGATTYGFSSTVVGPHTISAVYSGDAAFASSIGTVTVTVTASTLKTSTTTLAAATTSPISGTADAITITVNGGGNTPAPTGAVSVTVDSGTPTTVTLTPGTTTSTATYNFTPTSAGTHIIAVTYLGDSNYQTSSGSLSLNVIPPSFSLTDSSLTISDGSTGTETITVTPNGFTGTVNLSLSSTIVNACYTVTPAAVTGATPVNATATIYTNASNCPSGALALVKTGTKSASAPAQPLPGRELPAGLAMAALVAAGFAGRRSRKLRGVIAVALLAAAGFAISGCGTTSTAGSGISTTAVKGAYTITVTGSDAATGTITSSTTFTLTIQ